MDTSAVPNGPAHAPMASLQPGDDAGWSWSRGAMALQRDLIAIAILIAAMQLLRLGFAAYFRHQLSAQAGIGEFTVMMLAGLPHDARFAIMMMAPSLLLGIAAFRLRPRPWFDRLRTWLCCIFVVLTLIMSACDLAFFAEFGVQFDERALGLFYDDPWAVVQTVWAEHHLVWLTLALGAVSAGLVIGCARLLRFGISRERLRRLPSLIAWPVSLLVLALLVTGVRGSLWGRPVQRKDIAATRDALLNKLVLNPWKAMQYAVEDHLMLLQPTNLSRILPDGDINAAVRRVTGHEVPSGEGIQAALVRTAAGTTAPPGRIVLLVMESYSAWPMTAAWRRLGLAGEGGRLLETGTGTLRFLSAGNGTMPSLNAILTGIYETGVNLNYRASGKQAFPTALGRIFRDLHWRTRFIYSGYGSWQRIADFAKDQGFDEVLCGADVGGGFLAGKEWGVDDDVTMDFAATRIAADHEPTLTIILTTSNHPPYSVDVAAKGFPMTALPEGFSSSQEADEALRVMGHFWYSDRCLGAFADKVLKIDPRALIAFTGDHTQHRRILDQPDLAESLCVPFVLNGPLALAGRTMPPGTVGGHLDIIPTLVELAAPAGFTYPALGRDLLNAGPAVGFGRGAVITPELLLAKSSGLKDVLPTTAAWDNRLWTAWMDRCAISWWMSMHPDGRN